MTSPPDPRVGRVDEAALRGLLGEQAEASWLDYKRDCDLDEKRGRAVIEIAKDLGAMSMDGGYLVIGADDAGRPAGAPLTRPELFDEASLFAKVKKYLPHVRLRSAAHSLDGQDYVVVHVAPHPDGFAIFAADGQYTPSPGAPMKVVFRHGDVFARHGTASERWQQGDVARIRARLRATVVADQGSGVRLRRLLGELTERLDRAWTAWLLVAVVPHHPGSAAVNAAAVLAAEQLVDDWAADVLPSSPDFLPPQLHGGVDTGPRVVLDYDLNNSRLAQMQRVELHPDGAGVAGLVVGRAVPRATGAQCPVLADAVELETANLLELCYRHAVSTGADGDLHLIVQLLPAIDDDGDPVTTVLTDDDRAEGVAPVASHIPQLPVDPPTFSATMAAAELTEPTGAIAAGYRLASGLLASGGRPQPQLLQPDGTLDPTQALNRWRRPLQQVAGRRGILSPSTRLL